MFKARVRGNYLSSLEADAYTVEIANVVVEVRTVSCKDNFQAGGDRARVHASRFYLYQTEGPFEGWVRSAKTHGRNKQR